MYTATVSSQRRVTLPKAFLDAMKVKPGDKLAVELIGQEIVLQKVTNISDLAGCLNKYAIYPIPTDEEIDKAKTEWLLQNYKVDTLDDVKD